MQKLSLTFKKHGEEKRINLKADDGLDLKQLWKFANKTTAKRWPEWQGTLQKMELKK